MFGGAEAMGEIGDFQFGLAVHLQRVELALQCTRQPRILVAERTGHRARCGLRRDRCRRDTAAVPQRGMGEQDHRHRTQRDHPGPHRGQRRPGGGQRTQQRGGQYAGGEQQHEGHAQAAFGARQRRPAAAQRFQEGQCQQGGTGQRQQAFHARHPRRRRAVRPQRAAPVGRDQQRHTAGDQHVHAGHPAVAAEQRPRHQPETVAGRTAADRDRPAHPRGRAVHPGRHQRQRHRSADHREHDLGIAPGALPHQHQQRRHRHRDGGTGGDGLPFLHDRALLMTAEACTGAARAAKRHRSCPAPR